MKVVLYFQSSPKFSASEKLSGVMSIAEKAKWHLQSVDFIPNAKNLRELIDFWKPVGAIVECGGGRGEVDTELFKNVPTVFFDRNPSTLPKGEFCVSHDSRATGALAARELLMLKDEHFAYVHTREHNFWSDEREYGFKQILKMNGRRLAVHESIDNETELNYQKRLRKFLTDLPTPCSIFAANDKTATDVIAAAKLLGKDVPGEISVLGVDNYTEICERTHPSLSSIEPDFRGGGETAALMLMALLREKDSFVGERLRTFGPHRVVRRGSTRRPTSYDPEVSAALELISREACSGLTAARAMKVFSCSRGYAEIRFRNATGHSPLEEIHAVRLERAKELLADRAMQIKIISDFTGFESPGALRKFFLKETGMTMSAYRKQLLKH